MSWEIVCFLFKCTTVLWKHFPWIYVRVWGCFFLLSEGILTSLMRISFLPLPALGLWKAEISQPVLWECASLAQEPVQLALVVLIAAIGGELSLGYLPGISWGSPEVRAATSSQTEGPMSISKVRITSRIWGSHSPSLPDGGLFLREDKQLLSKLPIPTWVSTLG